MFGHFYGPGGDILQHNADALCRVLERWIRSWMLDNMGMRRQPEGEGLPFGLDVGSYGDAAA